MTEPPILDTEAQGESRFVEEDVGPKVLVGHLHGVSCQAIGSRCHGEELDRRHSLRILSVEGISYVNGHLEGGYKGYRRRGLRSAGF